MQQVYGSSCILIGGVNKQEGTVELKGTLFQCVLISLQCSPGALLPPDEWKHTGEGGGGGGGGVGGAAVPTKVTEEDSTVNIFNQKKYCHTWEREMKQRSDVFYRYSQRVLSDHLSTRVKPLTLCSAVTSILLPVLRCHYC